MDFGLKNKAVIVTASSKGLGKATALELAKEGAHVLISSRNEEELQSTAKEIIKLSGNHQVYFATCDMTKPADIQALVETGVNKLGGVDILVNNTGGPPAGGFQQFDDEDWQYAFELNLLSYIRTIREVIPHMKKNKGGRIVNIASSSTKQAIDGLILSNTFRTGIVGLSKSLSRELAQDHILINTVGPGRIATERVAQLDQLNADKQNISIEEFKKQSEKAIPMGRYGEPEEFARAITFLVSDANTYLTGQSLVVDGGLVTAL
ncbi:SDR family oxidoreductase [Rossellomorea yichunensis]|uniref:SDR family oxidoreductase n=1 Tax=Rossellomorea yichunensis TaxID=3077331 RepID=UPI0028DEED80|nr:SDR family oxidoreductase [Rossellomorea sp. YC4-1]MDT9026487.1 SDR family oxidoreductase [Rossellomorea sp. YC4-1]